MLKAALAATLLFFAAVPAQEHLPIEVGPFNQQIHRPYPLPEVSQIAITDSGEVAAVTKNGPAVFKDGRWQPQPGLDLPPQPSLDKEDLAELRSVSGDDLNLRAVARHNGETAVAADSGLYIKNGGRWRLALPRQGDVQWAPVDVRAVAYDASGKLWFCAPQGAGYRLPDGEWRLFTGADGLPYNDFTCMAAGPESMWFGTANGAIHYGDGNWAFRQGRRWLLDNRVRDIAVDADGSAWIATPAGVSCIAYKRTTLADKARVFEQEIERYHRRTSYGYVAPAVLETPGDKSTAKPVFTDNDGHYTGMYLAAVSLGYAATGDERLRRDAAKAFRALAFLSEVTQGGTHPAPKGFIARAVVPTSEFDPNPQFDIDYDIRRNKADALWKIIQPRWPVDETGEWYWKNDSSSDELDGHFFGYAIYFDRACETEAEKDEVRAVVRRIIDHIIDHGFNLVDYDGKPTRWGHLSPQDLNQNEEWVCERGLNSYSMLTYLAVAHHVTGDPKYRDIYLELAIDHGYGMNGMTQPRDTAGPGSHGQPDDKMAFMNYYHLIRYETDPKLLSMFYHAIFRHWQFEKYERNPFTNFIYAACCIGKTRSDHWGDTDISPPEACFTDAVDTLKRYPFDRVEWPMSNAHRTDMELLPDYLGRGTEAGRRVDGYVFPIDESHWLHWGNDPYVLTSNTKGLRLQEGVHYLLAYYMGLAHGFIR